MKTLDLRRPDTLAGTLNRCPVKWSKLTTDGKTVCQKCIYQKLNFSTYILK